jgi:hypothetical protein
VSVSDEGQLFLTMDVIPHTVHILRTVKSWQSSSRCSDNSIRGFAIETSCSHFEIAQATMGAIRDIAIIGAGPSGLSAAK